VRVKGSNTRVKQEKGPSRAEINYLFHVPAEIHDSVRDGVKEVVHGLHRARGLYIGYGTCVARQ
jgi:hypothetical protein